MIVEKTEPVTLMGGGVVAAGDLEFALSLAPFLVAADGGAEQALAEGHTPLAVIGDLDSLSNIVRSQLTPNSLFEIAEQSSTDFHKALRNIKAPIVLGIGFLGARIDHQLAAFNTLVQPLESPCILLGETEVIFHVPPSISLPTQAGDIVSLFPLHAVSGRSTGLQWPLDGLHMTPSGCIGTSNQALGPLTMKMDGPGMLGIVPRCLLPQLMRAILQAPSWSHQAVAQHSSRAE